jgi:hypothetical protein
MAPEVDRIVAMFYFTIILGLFMTVIAQPDISARFSRVLDSILHNSSSAIGIILLQVLILIAVALLSIAIVYAIYGILKKIRTVSIYFLAIRKGWKKDDPDLQEVVQRITDKDWEMADFWSNQLLKKIDEMENEIPQSAKEEK